VIDDAERHRAEDGRVQGSVPKAEGVRYTCPMHPEVVADSPGRCPHCGMKLVEQEQGPRIAEGL
jgi:Cu+-exporting ATPase